MSKSELWFRGDKHADKQTHRHINTMTRPGLGAGPSEKDEARQNDFRHKLNFLSRDKRTSLFLPACMDM